jgi:hypothetical protein
LCRKRPQKLDHLQGKRPGGLPDHGEAPEQVILADQRNREQGPVAGPHQRAPHPAVGGGRRQDVRQLNTLLDLRELSGGAFPFADRGGEHRLDDRSLEMLSGARHEDLAVLVVLVDHAGIGARELRGAGHDRAQDGGEIQRGIDRLTDLAQRAKLAHRSRQFTRAGFELLEQAHVLDGDDGLVGKGFQQLDLGLRKATGFPAHDDDGTDRTALAQHRHSEYAPPASGSRQVLRVVGVLQRVGDIDDGASQDRPARRLHPVWSSRIHLLRHV